MKNENMLKKQVLADAAKDACSDKLSKPSFGDFTHLGNPGDDPGSAAKNLGIALHAKQDYYAHGQFDVADWTLTPILLDLAAFLIDHDRKMNSVVSILAEKYRFHCIQIGSSMNIVRFKITALSPLVPAVNVEYLRNIQSGEALTGLI